MLHPTLLLCVCSLYHRHVMSVQIIIVIISTSAPCLHIQSICIECLYKIQTNISNTTTLDIVIWIYITHTVYLAKYSTISHREYKIYSYYTYIYDDRRLEAYVLAFSLGYFTIRNFCVFTSCRVRQHFIFPSLFHFLFHPLPTWWLFYYCYYYYIFFFCFIIFIILVSHSFFGSFRLRTYRGKYAYFHVCYDMMLFSFVLFIPPELCIRA